MEINCKSEVKQKLVVDIYGTAQYDIDSVPLRLIEILRANSAFSEIAFEATRGYLLGTIRNKKIAVICGKEVSFADFTDAVNQALMNCCDLIFASTPYHGYKYDNLKGAVTGYYFIETSPLFMKIDSTHHLVPALQHVLKENYVNMLLNLI